MEGRPERDAVRLLELPSLRRGRCPRCDILIRPERTSPLSVSEEPRDMILLSYSVLA